MKRSRWLALAALFSFLLAGVRTACAQESDQVTASFLANSTPHSAVVTPHAHLNGQAHARHGIPNIDSLVNFNGHFFADGFTFDGTPNNHWYFNTVGNPPQMHGTTTLDAPIVPVTLDLRNADGTPRFVNGQPLISRPDTFITPTLNSPVFQNSDFSSSPVPTQITDAVQRASYFSQAKDDWHTLLAPSVKTGRTITLTKGQYLFALNADGSCCEFVLIDAGVFDEALFGVIVDTITDADVTTKDVSTFLFPNAYLFIGNPNICCILGFHTYVFDDSNPNVEQRWVFDYASWISPGLFFGGVADVTALSHEINELFNDPFVASDGVHDVTPWWLAPNGNCQDNLETGDVIEGLPNEVFPITMNGMTYHPQNEALLSWFEFESPSSAIDGAYSYPNEQTLTALSAPQNPGCH
ncbi:MAG TPA: hypothetical protein VKG23_11420 [Thermoanaerobaculia bacterium]|nr:hypothetical protein [Thermoanaerobaculia bacterium]